MKNESSKWWLYCIFLALLTSCSTPNQQASSEPSSTASPILKENKVTEITPPGSSAKASYTHTIKSETAYYLGGPQQGRPSEGKLSGGTKVALSDDTMGGYVFVEAENGIKAWVHADSVQPID